MWPYGPSLTGPPHILCFSSSLKHLNNRIWSIAHRAPLPMGFSRQEYWSGSPCPSPGDRTWVSCIAGRFFTIWAKWNHNLNTYAAAAAAKSLQSCPTLCDPIDRSPQGSSVPGILQARTLEWVAISFSSAWKWKLKAQLIVTPWTAAYQTSPSMGFFQARVLEWGAIAFSQT